jgi:hypothetical protein
VIGTIVGVNIDYEPGNWVVRRELEPTIGKVFPCGFIASAQGWPLLQRELVQQGAYGWVEHPSFVASWWTISRQISVHECTYELC